MHLLKKIAVLSLLLICLLPAVRAQSEDNISDKELRQYVTVMKEIQTINRNFRNETTDIIKAEGLEVTRFNVLNSARQNPALESDATEEEEKKLAAVLKKIDKMQEIIKKEIDDEVLKSGLTIERYEEINKIIEKNPELQQKIIKLMQQ
jgi:Cu2+-containing amine oxidase